MAGLNTLRQAFTGDRSAALSIASDMLSDKRETLDTVAAIIEAKHERDWNEEEARELCYNDEIPTEATLRAFSEIHQQILSISYKLPLLLAADGEETAIYEDELMDDLRDFAVLIANPNIRYGLLAGVDESIRDDVDEYMQRSVSELWETIYALTSTGAVSTDDLPPETASIVEEHEQAQREAADE